uniref:LOW QUALITY PROTEIN: olfactory receptor 18-like n=1 Tax=Castor canadensis TaxID=51338 RepID=A0A8B7TV78_CASCN|nr:LOW QUALITY PROTEIN: olfactory receptor 18-like [Castor canadensis]
MVVEEEVHEGVELSKNIEARNLAGVSEFHLMGLSEDPELQPILFQIFLIMYLITVFGDLLIIMAVSSDSNLQTPICASNVEVLNLTSVTEFHLMEISTDPEFQPIILGLFLSMYLVTVLGNLLIILAVISESKLHNPMYFFLCNLSLVDICFISTTVPKMIADIQTHNRVISYVDCLTQMSLCIIFANMDDMLLTVMAYDRFVAICHPLHYPVTMNSHFCCVLVLMSFMFTLLYSQLHNLIALQFTCFKDVEISNYFCDPSQILNLSCSETFKNSMVRYFLFSIFGFVPFSGILFSYYKIVSSILRMPSSSGKWKAFSTCGSHLSVVCLFYGTALGVYFASTVSRCSSHVVVASLMYTVVTLMLNPFIYCLSNRDISQTLKHLPNKTTLTQALCHLFGL